MFLLTFLSILVGLQTASCDKSDIGLTPPEMIANHGYPIETHYITTEDGYILAYYRIPHGITNNGTTPRPAALVMHGISGCSSDFVTFGPGRSLSYVLADAGYDVWIANSRGTTFSRNHTTIDPDVDPGSFYNFTWHEIGYYDLPAAIDYILELKKDDSLHFVAHSQGTTTFLVLATTRPEYNKKIKLASLMAAAGIVKHYRNVLVQDLCQYIDKVEVILNKYQIYETPFVKEIREYVSTTCADPKSNPICDMIWGESDDEQHYEEEFLPVVYSNHPANTGLKQYIHFGQLVRDGGFRYFDYGTETNLEVYGSEVPPDYDLSKITTPVAIYYAKNDATVTYEDELVLISMIPNLVKDYLVPYDLFGHGDFVNGRDVVELVYNELMGVMSKYQ